MEINNEKNIPELVLEKINQCAFGQLSADEQAIVAQYLSPEEYDRLYISAQNLKKYYQGEDRPPEAILHRLQTAVVQQRGYQTSGLWSPRVALWKVAAVMMPLFFVTIWWFLGSRTASINHAIVLRDTVYLEKNIIKMQNITDTIYHCPDHSAQVKVKVDKSVKQSFASSSTSPDTVNNFENTRLFQMGISDWSIQDIKRAVQSSTGMSMQEDQLREQFGFARI